MNRVHIHLIDTFPKFLAFWESVRALPLHAQLEAWEKEHMAPWPDLREKLIDDYARNRVDWRSVALQRVFPYLDQRLPAMKTAHEGILAVYEEVVGRARDVLGFNQALTLVVYVGIGCGAGWATQFTERPAILLGLENIAECGWTQPDRLRALIAHELGHLAHYQWRLGGRLNRGEGAWWQLYSEGFAQFCEHRITGREGWHMHDGANDDWLEWCRSNVGWLAREFLRRVDAGESASDFFGSWYDIGGRRQTGYFLGHELIRLLAKSSELSELALLSPDDPVLREGIETLAGIRVRGR